MGARCCRQQVQEEVVSPDELRKKWLESIFNPIGPTDPAAYFRATPHIALMGDSGCGKTLLFLRLCFAAVPAEGAAGIVSETKAFHCEPFPMADRPCMLWDFSGNPLLSESHFDAFHRFFLRGIIWVASMLDVRPTAIAAQRRLIRRALESPDLGGCFVVLIFNTYDLFADEATPFELTNQGSQTLRLLMRRYDITGVMARYTSRFTWGVCNVKLGWDDPRFVDLARWMYHFVAVY